MKCDKSCGDCNPFIRHELGRSAPRRPHSQSAGGGSDTEIALLKQRLRNARQKIGRLRRSEYRANTATLAARTPTFAEAASGCQGHAGHERQPAITVEGPVAPSGIVRDDAQCIMVRRSPPLAEQNSVTQSRAVCTGMSAARPRPNNAGTSPQKLNIGKSLKSRAHRHRRQILQRLELRV